MKKSSFVLLHMAFFVPYLAYASSGEQKDWKEEKPKPQTTQQQQPQQQPKKAEKMLADAA